MSRAPVYRRWSDFNINGFEDELAVTVSEWLNWR